MAFFIIFTCVTPCQFYSVILRLWHVFYIRVDLKYFAKFIGKQLRWSSFSVKLKKLAIFEFVQNGSVCFNVHSPWRLHLSGTVGMSENNKSTMLWLKTFLSSAKSLHRCFRMRQRAFLTSHFILFTH